MVAQPVDAVWVWEYNLSAQKAVYGRFGGDSSYTKDYLQVSNVNGSLLAARFPAPSGTNRFDLTYRWVGGSLPGFIKFSNDRQHLSWPTGQGGPLPWRLANTPTPAGPETFPGTPTGTTRALADAALARFASLGMNGVLVAVKLLGETDVLHIRAYISSPPPAYAFADTALMPNAVRRLTIGFNQRKACQSESFATSALYFDPDQNHDAWSTTPPAIRIASVTSSTGTSFPQPGASPTPAASSDDSLAEAAPFSQVVVNQILAKMAAGDFAVPDNYSAGTTRGSAQRAFAKIVKDNYRWECAITGIKTREFLVASHVVPWADDASIRTDPANGICLSSLVDKAFDSGFLTIDTGSVVHVDTVKLAGDPALLAQLSPYDGTTLKPPLVAPPSPAYLQRRLDKTP